MNITKEQVQQWCEENGYVLTDVTRQERFKRMRKPDIENLACMTVGININDLHKDTREERIVFTRWLLWDYWKKTTSMTLAKIGSLYFPRNHATVINGINKLSQKTFTGWQRECLNNFENRVNKIHKRLGIDIIYL